ncbi:endosomal/lysosomal proton channel TMEM175-like isoform X2 [Bolinopsis microptera]|uniref:endosomal/lysosomal proton channel TMEM175-like isoform X2 n=1 Tax=Bolinopsis microptera TaxID=2820187 RepID=UPI00307930F8
MGDYSISHGFSDPLRWWPVDRQNMFTDAVFSIAATIAVANLNLKTEVLDTEDFLLKDALLDHIPKFVAYFACFFVISAYWGCHVRLYNLVVNSNDVLTWLNLLLLCVLSFLPLTLSLWADSASLADYMSHFPSINLALACLIFTFTIFYVFRDRAAHHTHITSSQKTRRRFIILLYAWFPTLIGLFCIYIYKLAEFALCVVFVLVLLTAVVITRFERWYLGHRLLDIAVQQVNSPLPMERIEAFSDGVYAISMTLMAVQIAEKLSSSAANEKFLEIFANSSVAYLTCFGLVSILWFVHHQLCHNIQQSNPLIQTLNTLAISFVGGIPFSSGLIQHYANPHSFDSANFRINEEVCVQFHCMVLFFSGLFQALMWVAAIHMRVTSVNYSSYADALLFFKTMVVPYVSCILYLYSVFYEHSSSLFLALTCVTPFTFAAANYCHRKRQSLTSFASRLFSRSDSTNNLQPGLLESSANSEIHRSDHHPYISFSPSSP